MGEVNDVTMNASFVGGASIVIHLRFSSSHVRFALLALFFRGPFRATPAPLRFQGRRAAILAAVTFGAVLVAIVSLTTAAALTVTTTTNRVVVRAEAVAAPCSAGLLGEPGGSPAVVRVVPLGSLEFFREPEVKLLGVRPHLPRSAGAHHRSYFRPRSAVGSHA